MVDAIGTCSRCSSPIERGDMRCAICSFAVPASASQEREKTEVRVLRCKGCAAAVDYDAEAQAPRCVFCDSVMQLERLVDPPEQTELCLPFTVDQHEAHGAVKRWLGSLGWFRPSDLKEKARVEGVRPLQWVGWVFDAEALVSWTADSNQDSWRAAWAPHAGEVNLRFDDIAVSASRGLSDDEVSSMISSYNLATAHPLDMSTDPEGTTLEKFDVQRSQARARVSSAIEAMARTTVEKHHVPGTHTRNVRVVPLVRELVTRRYSFPAWIMAYRYKGELYRAVVCGQAANLVIGKAPYSVLRILAAVFALVIVVLVVLVALAG